MGWLGLRACFLGCFHSTYNHLICPVTGISPRLLISVRVQAKQEKDRVKAGIKVIQGVPTFDHHPPNLFLLLSRVVKYRNGKNCMSEYTGGGITHISWGSIIPSRNCVTACTAAWCYCHHSCRFSALSWYHTTCWLIHICFWGLPQLKRPTTG